ncbi:hypothetical protein EZV62_012942 [Acer yangbiense]|uniref:BHLH domain-containing protein n=1 Tax=Acer yangbiense TaxID=1000413 RepID=A0A5C7HY23_9ROSI|nr:hypothetical protein EZV62_012942 [Acer yangbiense]
MDTTILVDEVTRANFLRSVMNSFGCTYMCLWSYLQPPNCLLFWDGLCNEESNQAQRLFHEYCQSVFPVSDYNCVPGLAFKNSQQYIELNESELHRLASNETQRRFYQTAVFMACKSGEIEIGLSHSTQINMEMEIRNLFPVQDSARDQLSLPLPTDPNIPSSSSSSLRSLSMDSPESSSLIFNIPRTTHQLPETLKEIPSILPPIIPTTTIPSPHQQARQAFAQIRNLQLPTPENEDAVIARAILAVLTASSPSSSTSSSHQQSKPKASAFKNYNLGLSPSTSQMKPSSSTSLRGGLSMPKRAISYYIRLNTTRREHTLSSRPTSTQLHHMMSERKRREKLNESFQALRSLLPPGTKKDKGSLLISTRDHLSSLKAQIAELTERNKKLEEQLLPSASASASREAAAAAVEAVSVNQRVDIRVTPVPESTSEDRIIDLGLTVMAESAPMLDLAIRILEFLKQFQNHVSLISMEANTRISQSASFNHLTFRLRIIQGSEWDESAFLQAVRRVVADLAQ